MSPTEPTSSAGSGPPQGRPDFDRAAALRTVRYLAGVIGPREASAPAFARAGRWVGQRLESLGYRVRRQSVAVPAGISWGVPVDSGTTFNVIAEPHGFDARQPHLVVGAHLDTVPQAPGAEDNASGVAVILELARIASTNRTRLPLVFIAFGGEEPRGDGDDLHHFGSTAFVARLSNAERSAVRAMVALDRVGVGSMVPVCSGGREPPTVRGALLRAARRRDLAAQPCLNQSSDHWSFEKVGVPAARVGGTSYAEYHSAADLPAVVHAAQLARVEAVLWEWLRA